MERKQIMKEIEHKRDLWDIRSHFRMWDISNITLNDLDILEKYIDGKEQSGNLGKPDGHIELLLLKIGIDPTQLRRG